MTDELVEKVARAIYAQWPNTYTVRRPLTTTAPQYESATLAETWEEMCENTPSRKTECVDAARAVLAAIEAAGWAVVPQVATIEMINEWRQSQANGRSLEDGYHRMITARPPIGGESNG